MRATASFILGTAGWVTGFLAQGAMDPIRSLTLNPARVIALPVATGRVTTVSFPGPITAIDAGNVSGDPKVPAAFQLGHARGSSFFSVRATAPQGAGNLNVRYEEATYVFELEAAQEPLLALNLVAALPPAPEPVPRLSTVQLLGLLDKAKAYPLLKEQHPMATRDLEMRVATNRTDYGDFALQLREVYRLGQRDSLVFHGTITNAAAAELRLVPSSYGVRVGQRQYPSSVAEGPTVLAPGAQADLWIAITGSPGGGREDLALDNEFHLMVTRVPPAPSPEPTESTPAQDEVTP